MTPTELAALEAEVNTVVNTAGSIASSVAPQYAGFIVLGQAVAKLFPGVLNDIENLIAKKDPTDADNDAVAEKIMSLLTPEDL